MSNRVLLPTQMKYVQNNKYFHIAHRYVFRKYLRRLLIKHAAKCKDQSDPYNLPIAYYKSSEILLRWGIGLPDGLGSHRVPELQEVAVVKGFGQWPRLVVSFSLLSAQMAQSVVAPWPLLSVAVTVQATRPICVGPMFTPAAVTLESQLPSKPLCCLLKPTRQLRQTRLSVNSVAALQCKLSTAVMFAMDSH